MLSLPPQTMAYAAGCQVQFLGEQQSEPYKWYGETSSATKKCAWHLEALSGKRLGRLTRKGGA